ncbi:MAG: sodium:calcium antiporter [Gammaproteobacteria bacterium]
MPVLSSLSDLALCALLGAAGLVILVAGTRLARVAQSLAISTGLGEAVIGGALLGASTSLSGTVTSISAAAAGETDLAVSNAIGGIAVQTFFLAIADLCHRGANLEHAAASPENMANTALLTLLLACVLLLPYTPAAWLVFGVHPGSVLLPAIWLAGLYAVAGIRARPMWVPLRTRDTRLEPGPDAPGAQRGRLRLAGAFAILAVIMMLAGWIVAAAGLETAARFDARQSVVGALLTAVLTSLPELVTTLAAVRHGALQLAVGGIIGGNTFDVLFLSFSDAAYRDGSVYHVMPPDVSFWVVLTLAMTAVLSFGLVKRERHGPANIGVESLAVSVLYVGGLLVQVGLGGTAGS